LARTSASADSITAFPVVWPVISSALMMSTPEPTSVASVRANRAIVTLRTVSPILIGTRSLNRSQAGRPASLFFQRKNPQIEDPTSGKMMNQ
jgi:hypothetical protein